MNFLQHMTPSKVPHIRMTSSVEEASHYFLVHSLQIFIIFINMPVISCIIHNIQWCKTFYLIFTFKKTLNELAYPSVKGSTHSAKPGVCLLRRWLQAPWQWSCLLISRGTWQFGCDWTPLLCVSMRSSDKPCDANFPGCAASTYSSQLKAIPWNSAWAFWLVTLFINELCVHMKTDHLD